MGEFKSKPIKSTEEEQQTRKSWGQRIPKDRAGAPGGKSKSQTLTGK